MKRTMEMVSNQLQLILSKNVAPLIQVKKCCYHFLGLIQKLLLHNKMTASILFDWEIWLDDV